jgi:hypothetical protein
MGLEKWALFFQKLDLLIGRLKLAHLVYCHSQCDSEFGREFIVFSTIGEPIFHHGIGAQLQYRLLHGEFVEIGV